MSSLQIGATSIENVCLKLAVPFWMSACHDVSFSSQFNESQWFPKAMSFNDNS
jgi:hypothetical protein